jgi:hypothetical protein
MLKLLLKIWPSLVPITIYVFWVLVIEQILIKRILRRKDFIQGEKIVGGKTTQIIPPSAFSLANTRFVITLYASFILAIVSLLYLAFS